MEESTIRKKGKRRLKKREAATNYRSVGPCKCDVDAQTRRGKAERDVRVESTSSFRSKGCDDARLADRHNPGFQPASSLVVALGAFPTSANHRPWRPLKTAGVSATGRQYSRASSPRGIER